MALGDYFPGYNMINSYLHPERGYEDAGKKVDQAWQQASGYMQPFQQHGVDEYGRLSGATNNLLNPEQLENQWASGYKESPFAQDELKRAQESGLDAASAMGLSGSSAALENIQRTGAGIVNADRQQYLNDLIQKYLAGVQSSQNIYGTGAGVGVSMGQQRMQAGEDQAQMAYGAQNAPGQQFAGLLGNAASAAAKYYGAGAG